MNIIDLHCDTVTKCYGHGKTLLKNDYHIDFEKLKKGGSLLQCFAIYISREDTLKKSVPELDYFLKVYDYYLNEIRKSNIIRPINSYADIENNMNNNIISSILTIEDSALLNGDLNILDLLYDKGVRLMTLTWNYENSLGYPNSKDSILHMKGLKNFGIEAVRRMNDLGILVDVSHLSEGGFYDVIKYSTKPIVASHSCARTLCSHQRNLTDDQLKKISDNGGLIGVNFLSRFLEDDSNHTKISNIIDHIKYMANITGIDCIGLGSDFDGIECTLDIKDYSYFPILVDELHKYFTSEDVEKICYKNALRVFKECLK